MQLERDDPSHYCPYDEDPEQVERERERKEMFEALAMMDFHRRNMSDESLVSNVASMFSRPGGSRSMKGFSMTSRARTIIGHFDFCLEMFEDHETMWKTTHMIPNAKERIETVLQESKHCSEAMKICTRALFDILERAYNKMTVDQRKYPFGSSPDHIVWMFALGNDRKDTGIALCKTLQTYNQALKIELGYDDAEDSESEEEEEEDAEAEAEDEE